MSILIRPVCVSSLMISEIKRIIKDSEIVKEDDSKWPQKNKDGRQELEIRLGSDHIQFEVRRVYDSSIDKQLTHSIDSKDWFTCRCDGFGRPGGLASFLLLSARPQSTGFFSDIVAF